MAAGLGSRYGGNKQIDRIGPNGEILMEYSIHDAVEAGFDKVVFVIRKSMDELFRSMIGDKIAKKVKVEYAYQEYDSLPDGFVPPADRTKPYGTVHAVACAKDVIHEPFAVINADDYYGREAYGILGSYLAGIGNDSTEHAMVGYLLKNTMSPMGSVSRGVCKVKDGLLEGMRENTKIEFEGEKIVSHLPEGDVYLTGDEWVSMNFFGFSPKAFDYMQGYFERFIKDNVTEPKAEVLLPNCAGEMVNRGAGTIRVFSTSEKWFGMTYHEDRETVRQNLALKTRQGVYPEKLWEK
jgi:NDP-sugar pyrophosphorylase family protein